MVSSVLWHPWVLARDLQGHCFSRTATVLSQKTSLVSPQRSLGQISQLVKPKMGSCRGVELVSCSSAGKGRLVPGTGRLLLGESGTCLMPHSGKAHGHYLGHLNLTGDMTEQSWKKIHLM